VNNIKIKRLKQDDIISVNEFLRYVISDTFEKDGIGYLKDEIADEVEEKKRYLVSDIESMGKDHFFLIAKDASKVIGTIEYSPNDKFISSCTNGKLNGIAKVGTIYIHPDYQRMGLGSRLIKLILLELDKKNINEFCLDSGFKSAQKIWFKMFGKPEYHLKDFWNEGGDHMIWRNKTKEVLTEL